MVELAAFPGFRRLQVRVEQRDDAIYLTSAEPFSAGPARLGEHLIRWAADAPDRLFIAERVGGEWAGVTYAEALRRVERIAAALMALGAGPDRPVMILSGNSVRHASLMLACMHIGAPVAPVSPA